MKYIKKFKSLEEARKRGDEGLYSPHVDRINGYSVSNMYMASSSTFTCGFDNNGRLYIKKPSPAVYFNMTSGQVTLPSTGSFEYSTDKLNWSAATASQSFTSSFYLRGKNSTVGRFGITGSVGIEGNAMALIDWETLPDTVPDSAFYGAFYNAFGLTGVSSDFLPATTLGRDCYDGMFQNCLNLKTAPNLPATALTDYCYCGMFSGCRSLLNAPELPATTLGQNCYQAMFQSCSALTSAPALPATALAQGCYYYMFNDCKQIVKSPVLAASTLEENCYRNMFMNCTSLTSITCYATSITANNCTNNWVTNVASAGTFTGNKAAGWTLDSVNGVPSGWTPSWNNYVYFNMGAGSQVVSPSVGSFEYSYDAIYWSAATASQSFTSNFYLRGKNSTVGNFKITGSVGIEGNAMTLVDWETMPKSVGGNAFYGTFSACTGLTGISSNFLPATTLGNQCYQNMFDSCTNLTNTPILPATALTPWCYDSMFQGCTSLTDAPDLPATTLAMRCYTNMFGGCTSLTGAPSTISATTLAVSSCTYMFQGCTSLTTAPALPATALSEGCYECMFYNCTALVNAPTLHATTLGKSCYSYMFQNCTSLVNAPVLPAETLTNYCYQHMFDGCTSLSSITCNATALTATDCTSNWVKGVASTGTFTGNKAAGWTLDSVNGVPSGWTTSWDKYVYFNMGVSSQVTLPADGSFEYSTDKVIWSAATASQVFNTSFYLRGKNSTVGNFGITGSVGIEGNAMTLIDWETLPDTVPASAFQSTFAACTGLTGVSSDFLPATTASNGCYEKMFNGCTSLTTAPALPATTLAECCYGNMFSGCTSLVSAPALPATTLAPYCYSGMFISCYALENTPALLATSLEEGCYYGMFIGCRSLISSPVICGTTLSRSCYGWMFSGCTSLVNAPELPATALTVGCYSTMFASCTSLKGPITLPAETLNYSCYYFMFWGCTSLTSITCNATAVTAQSCTGWWVKNVASAGTFTGNRAAGWALNSVSGVPIGWTASWEKSVYFNMGASSQVVLPSAGSFEYSYDESNWSAATASQVFNTSFYLRGKNSTVGNFKITGSVGIEGNAMALIDYENLSTTMEEFAFEYTFSGCTGLTGVSSDFLRATTLNDYCYHGMFSGCTSLVSAPNLNAIIGKRGCYESMFIGCTSLENAPLMAATTLSSSSCQYMFQGCSNLVTAPVLPASILGEACYRYMFRYCTKLTTAPTLGATNIEEKCYVSMFEDCTSLTGAPNLPALTLRRYCYQNMFKGCTSLMYPPVLSAETLGYYCYNGMFSGCSSLSSITCLATSISDTSSTTNWMCGVASAGTFAGYEDAGWEIDSVNGVPSGWTKHWYSCVYFNMTSGQVTLPSTGSFEYSTDKVIWSSATASQVFNTSFYLRGSSNTTVGKFGITGSVSISGNAMTLMDYEDIPTTVPTNGFSSTFNGCTGLTSVSTDFLPATAVSYGGYNSMFAGCTSLTGAPTIHALTLGESACYNMFYNCTSLVTAPEILTTTATGTMACAAMFRNCSKLATAPSTLYLTGLTTNCCGSMFQGCSKLTAGPVLCATTMVENCYQSMFKNCSSLTSITCFAEDVTAITSCTANWVNGVSSSGIFTGNKSAGWSINSVNGVPNGWTPKWLDGYVYFNMDAGQVTLPSTGSFEYSMDKQNWSATTASQGFTSSFYLRGKNTAVGGFGMSGSIGLEGNAMALLDYEILSDTVGDLAFSSTFNSCTAITSVTSNFLPATTVGMQSYENMFDGCTSLVNAPALPATTLGQFCYANMFDGCTSLVTAPALPATALSRSCYYGMFEGCTSLKVAPLLPAETLADYCYQSMFAYCNALESAEGISATTLGEYCCCDMFNRCISLTTAPTLFATTLSSNSYYEMFNGCTSLASITCYATNGGVGYTENWVRSVSSEGDFYTPSSTTWSTSVSGIPEGWTRHDI